MSKVVLDASAVLAVLQREPGADKILTQLQDAAISAVNFAEVVSKLSRSGDDFGLVLSDLHNLVPDIRPFDGEQAVAVGHLDVVTRAYGLSLGDRACLVLARTLSAPVLTADQAWAKLDIGISIELIRAGSSH
jgi:PIN domain nuclease of toxin-antitoxin system